MNPGLVFHSDRGVHMLLIAWLAFLLITEKQPKVWVAKEIVGIMPLQKGFLKQSNMSGYKGSSLPLILNYMNLLKIILTGITPKDCILV